MVMDSSIVTKNVTGGTNASDATDLNQILAALDAATVVLFAQGTYKLTANLTIDAGVTLIFDAGSVSIDGGEYELTVPEGRVIVTGDVTSLDLSNLTLAGGMTNNALLTIGSGSTALDFSAGNVKLSPSAGSSAISFAREVIEAPELSVVLAGSGTELPDVGPSLDLGSGFDTTVLPRVYQEQQGPMSLTDGLLSIRSDISFQSATVTISDMVNGDTLLFSSDAEALAGLLRVSLSFDAETGVLSITPAQGSLLNAGLVELLLGSVSFENDTTLPGVSRNFDYALTDKDGNVLTATAVLQINDLNEAPALQLNALGDSGWVEGGVTATFEQGTSDVDITTDAEIALSDVEDDAINFVTLRITDAQYDKNLESLKLRDTAQDGDLFGLSPSALAAVAGITVAWDADSATLTLSAADGLLADDQATTDLFEFLVNEVKYANTAPNPVANNAGTSRTIEVIAEDTLTSNPAKSVPLTFTIGLQGDNLDAINNASNPDAMKLAIEDTTTVSQAITDLLAGQTYSTDLSDPLRASFLQALIDNRPDGGFTTFKGFADDYVSPLLDVFKAGIDLVAAANQGGDQGALALGTALQSAITAFGETGLTIGTVGKAELETAKTAFDALDAGRQTALANDLSANGVWTADDLAGNLLGFGAALVDFRTAVQDAVSAANDGTLAVSDLQAVSDKLDAVKAIKADATINGGAIADAITNVDAQITALNDLTTPRLNALLKDIDDAGDYASFTELFNKIEEVEPTRTAVQDAVDGLVETANASTGLAVSDFQSVADALKAIVDADLTTEVDGAPVEDISASDLASAITLFVSLSQATQDDVLARVQEGTSYTDLASVLNAVEPAIRAELLEQLNAAIDAAAVVAVLGEAATVYAADTNAFTALSDDEKGFVAELLLFNKPDAGYASFDAAESVFNDGVTLAAANIALLGAVNAADVAALTTALGDLQTALGSVADPDAIGQSTAQEVQDFATGIGSLEAGRAKALANDLQGNGPWTAADLVAGDVLNLGDALLDFRAELQVAVGEAADGSFTRGADGTLEGVVEKLEAVKAVKSDATINGVDITTVLDGGTVDGQEVEGLNSLVTRVNALSGEVDEPRFEAFLQDLAAADSYASFSNLLGTLDDVLGKREAAQTAVGDLIDKANASTGLAVSDFQSVADALQAIVDADLTTEVDGAPVEDISASDLASAITLFGNLSQGTQDDVLVRVQEGTSYTDLASVLNAVGPALEAEALEQLNTATTATEVLAVLSDIDVYVDDAALTAVLGFETADKDAVAADLLLNRPDSGFTTLDDANKVLGLLEDVVSGLDVGFDAELFTLGQKGADSYELAIGTDTIKLAAIGSVVFNDKTAHVVGNGGIVGIRAAIDISGDGDVVLVSPGSHNITEGGGAPTFAGHNVQNLTFLGAGETETTITGNARIANLSADGGRPTGMTVEGMTLSYENGSGYIMQWGDTNNVAGLTLKDVTFTGNHVGNTIGAYAPYADVRGADNLTLDGVTVELTGSATGPQTTHFLFGEGDGITIKNSSFAGTFTNAVNLFESTNVLIQDNTFGEGNGFRQEGVAVTLSQTSGVVKDNTFKDGAYLDLRQVEGNTIDATGNTFTLGDGEFGILLRTQGSGDPDNANIDISSNTFTLGEGAIPVSNDLGTAYTFGVNTVDGASVILKVGTSAADTLATTDGSDELIAGQGDADIVTFSGNFADYTVSVAADGTISVSKGGETDTLIGVEALKFVDGFGVVEGLSIQTAIDLATAGDAINVAAGTFAEVLNVDKFVTLKGAFAGTAGTDGSRGTGETVISASGDFGVEITASDVVFDGFKVSNDAGNAIRVVGFTAPLSNVSISNNVVDGVPIADGSTLNVWNGVGVIQVVAAGAGNDMSNVTVSGNLVTASGAEDGSVGIKLRGTDGATITSSTVSNNKIVNASTGEGTSFGVYTAVSVDDQVAISNNEIDGFDFGAVAGNQSAPSISGNTFTSISQADVALFNDANATVGSNTWTVGGKGILHAPDADATEAFDFTGGAADDIINGGASGDVLDGGAGADVLRGRGGDDVLRADLEDTLDGGDGTDIAIFAAGTSVAQLEGIAANITNVEVIRVEGASDTDPDTYVVLSGMSIQAAIDAASAGDTILLGSGKIDAQTQVNVTKSLTIEGKGETDTTLDVASNGYGVLVTADNVTISGLTFDLSDVSSYGLKVNPAGGATALTGFTLKDATVKGSAASRIDLNGVDNSSLVNVTADAGAAVKGVGIAVSDSTGITLTDITTNGNPWGSIGLYSAGRSFEAGTSDVTFTGSYTFNEAAGIYADEEVKDGVRTQVADIDFSGLGWSTVYKVQSASFRDASDGRGEDFTFFFQTEAEAIAYAKLLASDAVITYDDTPQSVDAATGPEFIVAEGMSIQAAVDAAADGNTVTIRSGAFAEVVTLPDGKALSVLGSGEGATTLDGAFNVAGDGSSIEGLTISNGGNTSGSTAGVYIAASGVTLTDLTLTGPSQGAEGGQARAILTASGEGSGLKVSGVTASDWATGIYLNPGATQALVENSDFSGNYVGMSIDGEDNVTLTGNTFGGTLEDLGLGKDGIASATGNSFVNGKFGNYTGGVVELGANTVSANSFATVKIGTNEGQTIASSDGSVELLVGLAGDDIVTFSGNFADYTVSVAADGTISVSRDGETYTLVGVEALKFADGFGVVEGLSIQTAIDLATAGDTIRVAAGSFDETLEVNKAVSIVGPNSGTTGFASRVTEAVIGGKVTVSDGGASIDGFTLSKPSTSSSDNSTNFSGWGGINLEVTGDGATVSNTIVEAFGAAGGFAGSGFVTLAGAATFTGNLVKAGDGYNAANDARGVSSIHVNADTGDAVTISNNHLLVSTNVAASPNDADALFLGKAGEVVIDGNLLSGTDGGFVAFGDYGKLTITGNTIETYAKTGLRIFESTNATKPDVILSGNTIDASGSGVLSIAGTVKLGSDVDGSGFAALASNLGGIPAIYRANAFAGEFGVLANGKLSLFADQADAVTAAGATGVIWNFTQEKFQVFNGMSIQAALDAAEAGDSIVVSDGNFGPVTLDKSVTLVAAADASPKIIGGGVNQGAAVRVDDGVDNASISGFTIEAGEGDLTAVYLAGNNENIVLASNTISGGSAHAVLSGGGVAGVTLSDNSISGDGPAAVLYVNGEASLGVSNSSSNVSLLNNTITGGADAGLLVGLESIGGVVQGNTFSGSASYAALELWGTGVTVGGKAGGEPNVFGSFPRVIIDAQGNYTVTDLLANNTFATPEIALIRNTDTGSVYNSLVEAFADAKSGETVKISAGELDLSSEGRLTVPAGVTLMGSGLDGDDKPLTTLKGALLELAAGATVDGLAFTDFDPRLGGGEPALLLSGDGATVKASTFSILGVASNAYGTEIRVTGDNATITGNTIFRDAAGDVVGSSIGNSAISADGVSKITISGNTLERAIIGVVTAANDVDLTITGNKITPTVVSNDAIFVTGPGFGNIPDGSAVNIGGNTYIANANNVLLGLQLRGTAADGFDFTDYATSGRDFFQGGSGDDTFVISLGNDQLEGGTGEDTVVLVANNFGVAVDLSKYDFSEITADAQGAISGSLGVDGDSVTLSGIELLKVGNTGTSGEDTYVVLAGMSIQTAVDAAKSGDVIMLAAGAFAEVVTLPDGKALSVLGSGEGVTTLDGAFNVAGDGSSIEGLTISNGGNTSGSTAGVYIAASGVTLTDLTLTGPSQGAEGGQARAILTASGEGSGLKVSGVTASDWATGIYLNPGATQALVENSDFSGNYVGMSIDGEDNVTLTGNTFNGTLEDLGLGKDGIASATGNSFVNGKFGNYTGGVVELGANTVKGVSFDAVKIGTGSDDSIGAGGTGNELVIGGADVDALAIAVGIDLPITGVGFDTADRVKVSYLAEDDTVAGTTTLEGVERISIAIGANEADMIALYGSVPNTGGEVVFSLEPDAGFPVKLGGAAGSRPDLYLKALDLPAAMKLAAAELAGEDVVITVQDGEVYPGEIDLTGLAQGFNAKSITINRDGDSGVFIGPVFVEDQAKLILGGGVNFANVAPVLVNGAEFVDDAVFESLTGDAYEAFTVAELNSLFSDDDVGSSLAGIALTGIEASGGDVIDGRWEFKTASDSAFRDILVVTASENLTLGEASSLLLAADTQLRFVPDAATLDDRNAGRVPELSFVAVDSTQPVQGGNAFTTSGRLRTTDVTERGGSTPYSDSVASYNQDVKPLSDPGDFAALDLSLANILEDANTGSDGSFDQDGGASVSAVFGTSFADTTRADDLAGVVVVSNAALDADAKGNWQYRIAPDGAWADVGTVSSSEGLFLAADAQIRFVPNWNFNGEAPELAVRAVSDATGLSSATPVDVTQNGLGTVFSASTATLGIAVEGVDDSYTLGRNADGAATLSFAGNPGSVQSFQDVPVISLLNFDRDGADGSRDVFRFVDDANMDLPDTLSFANGFTAEANTSVNFVAANVNVTGGVTAATVGDAFNAGLSLAGRFATFSFQGTTFAGDEFGSGLGLFRDQASGITSLWYAEELNPLVSAFKGEAFEATLLAYIGGEDWSVSYQDDPTTAATPTATVEELRLLASSDFAFV